MSDSDALIVETCMSVWRKFVGEGSLRSLKEGLRTVFAGIVLCDHSETPSKFQCISLGTGTKCLPQYQLPSEGDALHDTHAEVLARRGVVRWLLGEYSRLQLAHCGSSEWLRRTSSGLVGLKPSVSMHMYVSSLPCGDASMLSLALGQDPLIAALKDSGNHSKPQPGTALRGRNYYSAFGALRTKPGRADSIPSISMSCSDKILKWCLLGIQGAAASLRFEPIYLSSIVIGDVPMPNRDKIAGECERAFSPHRHLERPFDESWESTLFSYHRITVRFTDVDFPASQGHRFCDESIAWNAHGQLEVLVNGRLQGSSAKSKRGKVPSLSRAAFRNLYEHHGWTWGQGIPYNTLKRSSRPYQTARDQLMAVGCVLEGWIVAQEDRIT